MNKYISFVLAISMLVSSISLAGNPVFIKSFNAESGTIVVTNKSTSFVQVHFSANLFSNEWHFLNESSSETLLFNPSSINNRYGFFKTVSATEPLLNNGLAVAWESDQIERIHVAHPMGELAMITPELSPDGSLKRIHEIFLRAHNGDETLIEVNEDGKPSRVFIAGHLILLDNYRENLVDAAIIAPDGTVTIHRDIDISEAGEAPSMVESYGLQRANERETVEAVLDALILTGRIVSTVLIIKSVIATGGATLPLAYALLPALLPEAAKLLLPEQVINEASMAYNGVACATVFAGNIDAADSCMELVLDIATIYRDTMGDFVDENQTAIDEAATQLCPLPSPPAGGDPTASRWEVVNERWVKNIYTDGAVTMSDRDTGLMWVYDASANGTANWDNAITHCNNLIYAGKNDWYLPDINELSVMYSQKAVFTNVQDSWFWSSTPEDASTIFAWYVDMFTGEVNIDWKGALDGVWPCRIQ